MVCQVAKPDGSPLRTWTRDHCAPLVTNPTWNPVFCRSSCIRVCGDADQEEPASGESSFWPLGYTRIGSRAMRGSSASRITRLGPIRSACDSWVATADSGTACASPITSAG